MAMVNKHYQRFTAMTSNSVQSSHTYLNITETFFSSLSTRLKGKLLVANIKSMAEYGEDNITNGGVEA